MTRQEVKEFLSSKPGYQKYGYSKLAALLKTDRGTIKEVIGELNTPSYTQSISVPVLTDDETLFKEFLNWKKAQIKPVPTYNTTTPGIHLISGCNHVPFHNKKMLNGMLRLIQDLGPKLTGLHLIGDFLDLNSLSKHDSGKVPMTGITLGKEYAEGNKVLDAFSTAIGNRQVDKTFIYGNHEDRYFRHLADIDNSKFADALMGPTEGLKLNQRGFKVYENWKEDHHLLGSHLQLIHGEFCSKSPARTHMDKLKGSVMFAHTHRIDVCYDGEKAGFNIGWGGDKDAAAFSYVSRITKMNWINGFALVHIDEKGNFFTQVIPVYHDTFWYNGTRY